MKKVVLSLAVVALATTSAFAQKYNADALKAKITKSDTDIADAKKNVKASTWLSRGAMFNSIAMANSSSIFIGMAEPMLIETVGKPTNANNILSEKINGEEYKKFEYPTVDIYIKVSDSSVAFWIEKSKVSEDAAVKAVEAFNKALELDPKSKDKVAAGYAELVGYLSLDGQNMYDAGKYKEASVRFGEAAQIDYANPAGPTASPDDLFYFSGVAAAQGLDYKKSSEIFTKLIEKGIEKDGDTYFYAGIVLDQNGDKEAAKAAMQKGIEKYLDNQRLLQQYITFSLQNNAGAEAVLPYITKAQEKEPNNTVYIIAEGIVYDQSKDYDKAIAAYEKVLAIEPENFGALYNLGFAYRSKAIKSNEGLRDVDFTNTQLVEQLKGDFLKNMQNAIVPFEKAHKIKPTDKLIVEVLKSIFFSLRDESPEMMASYQKYDELHKSM